MYRIGIVYVAGKVPYRFKALNPAAQEIRRWYSCIPFVIADIFYCRESNHACDAYFTGLNGRVCYPTYSSRCTNVASNFIAVQANVHVMFFAVVRRLISEQYPNHGM